MDIMESFFDGVVLDVVKKIFRNNQRVGSSLSCIWNARDFGRQTGFNKGLGGSMHVFYAIWHLPKQCHSRRIGGYCGRGSAVQKVNRKPGMVVVNIGDGALAVVRIEGITFSMDQFKNCGRRQERRFAGDYQCCKQPVWNGGQTWERPWVMKLLPALVRCQSRADACRACRWV